MSCNVKVDVKLNPEFINALTEDIKKAAMLTMEELKDDISASQTVPFDSGNLQNDAFTFTVSEPPKITSVLLYGEPYARYQYYGKTKDDKPLNYQTVNNPYARSHWLEPYADGVYLKEHFTENLRRIRGNG